MVNRIAQYDSPDDFDEQSSSFQMPAHLEELAKISLMYQSQTDQSRAPEIDEKAKLLIRKCVWDLLPKESAEYIEGLGIRFKTWNEALFRELLDRQSIERYGGTVPTELL
jgi:hypothetical protein